jgi:DNA primase
LQSSGCVSSSTTYKDKTGNILSTIKTVNSHFASLIVTTKSEIYYDNMSRCVVVGINESKSQTENIIEYQNSKMTDSVSEISENNSKEFLQNCIRCIKNSEVVNPYADKVIIPFEAKMPRRLNNHFHLFIKQITLLHQYQRKRDRMNRLVTEPIDVRIACDILFDSIMMKVDDMDASLRQFFEKLKEYIKRIATDNCNAYEFSQREIRLALNLCKTSCKDNLNELLVLEYIEKTGGYSNRGFKYKIIYWDDIVKLKTEIKQKLYEQLDLMEGLVAAGEHLQNGHQDSRGTKEKPLVAANFQNTYKRGGKK